jgi:hypothetical protein
MDYALVIEQDLLDVDRVGHHDDDDVGLRGSFCDRGASGAASLQRRSHGFRPAAVHVHGVAGLLQIDGHGLAHDAHADECDVHRSPPSALFQMVVG